VNPFGDLVYSLTMLQCPFDFATPDYPLASASLYNVGGPAKLALLPKNRGEVESAYQWIRGQHEPVIVLGGGSNVLISDEGFPGIVLFTTHLTEIRELDVGKYWIDGGVILDDVVDQIIVKNNFHGAGGLTGIPGTVGGAIFMNAGTVNGSICQLMESVDVATNSGTQTIPMETSLYSYRGQTFCPPSDLILGGVFKFTPSDDDQRSIYDHYIERRKHTQPQGFCCGSVFKNPEGNHSGKLIESCGLKGTRSGGAVISDLHANFIVNDQNATCADILSLINLCKKTVKETHNIQLEEEVKIFGRPETAIPPSN
jgi:UDP-N-acetylmuramate dehydrogenase